MKVREEIIISNIYQKNEKLNISSHKTNDFHYRPVSANLNRPDSKLKINQSIHNGLNTPLSNNLIVSNNFKAHSLLASHTDSQMKKNFGGKKCTELICMDLSHIICVFEHIKNLPLTECAKWLFLG